MSDLWKRWQDAAAAAEAAVAALKDVQTEFQEKYDQMSEKQQESEKGERLNMIVEVDLDGAQDIINEALGVEKP